MCVFWVYIRVENLIQLQNSGNFFVLEDFMSDLAQGFKQYVLSVLVENHAGVLSRVSGLSAAVAITSIL